VARPADQALEPGDERVAGEAAAREREVRGGRPVQRAEPANPVRTEPLRLPPRLSRQPVELVPRGTAIGDETV